MAVPMAAAAEEGIVEPPDSTRPGPFTLADPDRLLGVVDGSGFADPEIEEIAFAYHYSDFHEFWDVLVQLSSRFATAVAALSERDVEEFRGVLAEKLAPFRAEDGSYTVEALSWGVRARR
jgi:hypothetical protein